MRKSSLGLLAVIPALVISAACSKAEHKGGEETAQPQVMTSETHQVAERLMQNFQHVPLGLFAPPIVPEDNPMTVDKVELGYLLYFDKRLSNDNTVSCATCHNPATGWTDQLPVSTGIHGQKGTRSAPTVVNAAYMFSQFWDGRAATLEDQALQPIINPVEMGQPDHSFMVNKLDKISGYEPYFQKVFGEGVTKENVSKAIAAFERTILAANSRYDRYSQGDKSAMNASEVRGMDLFFGKANCSRCHAGPNFSDSQFHNLGVGMDAEKPDLGRYDQTKVERDKGAFKTPNVRDITKTAPYMHNGSEKTLKEVVEFYDRGGNKNPQLDPLIVPLNLTDQEQADIIAYLKALDSDPYPFVPEPKQFPQ